MLSSETQAVAAFLEAQSTLALATIGPDGRPQTAPVFYVSDAGWRFYWLSSPDSRHSRNLARHPDVAASIYPAVWRPEEIRGLQIEGVARALHDPGWREDIVARYVEKFALPPEFQAEVERQTLYLLEPRWMRWLDNSVRFGYKAQLLP